MIDINFHISFSILSFLPITVMIVAYKLAKNPLNSLLLSCALEEVNFIGNF